LRPVPGAPPARDGRRGMPAPPRGDLARAGRLLPRRPEDDGGRGAGAPLLPEAGLHARPRRPERRRAASPARPPPRRDPPRARRPPLPREGLPRRRGDVRRDVPAARGVPRGEAPPRPGRPLLVVAGAPPRPRGGRVKGNVLVAGSGSALARSCAEGL